MEFKAEYKERVFNLLRFDTNVQKVMQSLEKNNPIAFRFNIEVYLDTLKENLKPRILVDDGDRLVYNSIVSQYKATEELYTEFMDEYIQEIDVKESQLQVVK